MTIDRQNETERDAVGGVEQKTERDRVHERDIGEVEFLSHGRAIVVVPAEGNAVACRGKFADEGRGPANQPEPPGSAASRSAWIAANKKGGKKDEDVGAEEDGFEGMIGISSELSSELRSLSSI